MVSKPSFCAAEPVRRSPNQYGPSTWLVDPDDPERRARRPLEGADRAVELPHLDGGPDRRPVGLDLVGRHGDLAARRRTVTVGDRHVLAHARPVEQPTTRLGGERQLAHVDARAGGRRPDEGPQALREELLECVRGPGRPAAPSGSSTRAGGRSAPRWPRAASCGSSPAPAPACRAEQGRGRSSRGPPARRRRWSARGGTAALRACVLPVGPGARRPALARYNVPPPPEPKSL